MLIDLYLAQKIGSEEPVLPAVRLPQRISQEVEEK